MLRQILTDDPSNINALLWMTEVAPSSDERRKYLNQILAIDPHNIAAHRGLKLLEATNQEPPQTAQAKKTDPSLLVLSGSKPAESNIQPVEPTKKCPYCAETIKAKAIVCRFCGRDLTGQLAATNARHAVLAKEIADTELAISRAETELKAAKEAGNGVLLAQFVGLACIIGSFLLGTTVFSIVLLIIAVLMAFGTLGANGQKRQREIAQKAKDKPLEIDRLRGQLARLKGEIAALQ